jgi:phasin family protein
MSAFPKTLSVSPQVQAQFDTQIASLTALATNALDGVSKIVELNLSAVKASTGESIVSAKQILAAKDPQEFFALSTTLAQQNAEKMQSYGRHLTSILTATQAVFTNHAESQIADAQRSVTALVDEVTKNAPAGTEPAVAMLKSALGNAAAGYEQLTKTSKQAAEAIESNLTNVHQQVTQAVEKVVAHTSKK